MTLTTLCYSFLCFFTFISLLFLYACLRKFGMELGTEIPIEPNGPL